MVTRGRWDQTAEPAGLQAHRSGVSGTYPVVQPESKSGAWWAVCSGGVQDRKSEALLSAPHGISDPVRRTTLPNRGVRERPDTNAGCHATPRTHEIALLRIQRGSGQKHGPSSLRVQTAMVRWGESRLPGQSGFSQLKLSVVQAKAIFISNDAAHCAQRRRQRFPTVRRVAGLGNGEEEAKSNNIRACTSTAQCKPS